MYKKAIEHRVKILKEWEEMYRRGIITKEQMDGQREAVQKQIDALKKPLDKKRVAR